MGDNYMRKAWGVVDPWLDDVIGGENGVPYDKQRELVKGIANLVRVETQTAQARVATLEAAMRSILPLAEARAEEYGDMTKTDAASAALSASPSPVAEVVRAAVVTYRNCAAGYYQGKLAPSCKVCRIEPLCNCVRALLKAQPGVWEP